MKSKLRPNRGVLEATFQQFEVIREESSQNNGVLPPFRPISSCRAGLSPFRAPIVHTVQLIEAAYADKVNDLLEGVW